MNWDDIEAKWGEMARRAGADPQPIPGQPPGQVPPGTTVPDEDPPMTPPGDLPGDLPGDMPGDLPQPTVGSSTNIQLLPTFNA
jgi:hypothetical protein